MPSYLFEAPVGISGRHLHLSQADLETLFGAGSNLLSLKELSQPGQFAAQETVTLATYKGVLEKVRVLGPVRSQTQVEISLTDAYRLGLFPPVRESGNLEGTPGATLVGPRGVVVLSQGVILAARHLHLSLEESQRYGLADGQEVKALVEGDRSLVLNRIIVRVRQDFRLDLHLDTDEANSACLRNGDKVKIFLE